MKREIIKITEDEWQIIKDEYQSGVFSVREIARRHGLRDKRVNDRAKLHKWVRPFSYGPGRPKASLKTKPAVKKQDFPTRTLDDNSLGLSKPADFSDAVRSILGPKTPISSGTPKKITPECGPEVPHPFMGSDGYLHDGSLGDAKSKPEKFIYTERYEAIRLELTRRRKLAQENRLDEDALIKLIDRVGALDTEGAVEELIIARMQINADTLARTAELKAIRDRYVGLVADFMGPDEGKAARAAMILIASKNDSIQGAIKLIADIDKQITDAERKAFDMDKVMAKTPPSKKKGKEIEFDPKSMSVEELSALMGLVHKMEPVTESTDLPLPPTDGKEPDATLD